MVTFFPSIFCLVIVDFTFMIRFYILYEQPPVLLIYELKFIKDDNFHTLNITDIVISNYEL